MKKCLDFLGFFSFFNFFLIHGFDFFNQNFFAMTTCNITHEKYFNYLIFLHFYQYFLFIRCKNACVLHTCSLLCNISVNKVWSWSLYLFYFFSFKNDARCVCSVICFSLYTQNYASPGLPFWHKVRTTILQAMELVMFFVSGVNFVHRNLIQTFL